MKKKGKAWVRNQDIKKKDRSQGEVKEEGQNNQGRSIVGVFFVCWSGGGVGYLA